MKPSNFQYKLCDLDIPNCNLGSTYYITLNNQLIGDSLPLSEAKVITKWLNSIYDNAEYLQETMDEQIQRVMPRLR